MGIHRLLGILLIIVSTIYTWFSYMNPEKSFSKSWVYFYRLKTVCFVLHKNQNMAFFQMVGAREANAIVGITWCTFSDCHPEPQSQMYNGLCLGYNYTLKVSISKWNSSRPPYVSELHLGFSISFNGLKDNWIQWFIRISYPPFIFLSLQIFST